MAGRSGGIRCKMAIPDTAMCSNFGLNLHPDRVPAVVESHWRSVVLRMFAWFRRRFSALVRETRP